MTPGVSRSVLVAALTAFLLAGCARQNPPGPAASTGIPVTLDEDALETTFRHLMDRGGEGETKTDLFFLELPDGRDPTERLIAHLNTPGARVEAKSACTTDPQGIVRDCARGVAGALLTVRGAKSGPEGSIEVEVEQHRAPLNSEGDTLTLQKRSGKWVVIRFYARWMS